MYEKKIRLDATDDVKEFVTAASSCDFDVYLQFERAVVNAKSFLGVLSLGLSKNLIVNYGGENHRFEQILKKYSYYR